ncbi:MAG: hypothetical protein OHK0022_10070 [Roseiflexaceae bacterium]
MNLHSLSLLTHNPHDSGLLFGLLVQIMQHLRLAQHIAELTLLFHHGDRAGCRQQREQIVFRDQRLTVRIRTELNRPTSLAIRKTDPVSDLVRECFNLAARPLDINIQPNTCEQPVAEREV